MTARGILVGLGRRARITCGCSGPIPRSNSWRSRILTRRAAPRRPLAFRVFESFGDAASAVKTDFACVATPVHLLPEVARQALAEGLAVMVEKPMGIDETAARELVADAAERGLLLAAGLVERCNPAVSALRAMLKEGMAGRVYRVHARRLSPYPGRESQWEWRSTWPRTTSM
jgi:predicted dehydrogenase